LPDRGDASGKHNLGHGELQGRYSGKKRPHQLADTPLVQVPVRVVRQSARAWWVITGGTSERAAMVIADPERRQIDSLLLRNSTAGI